MGRPPPPGPAGAGVRLRIGDLTFDGGRRLVTRGTVPVHLSPRAFQLLELLLSRRPDAVRREEIARLLWPGDPAATAHLLPAVCELRRALHEPARAGGFIRTVPGYGYAFDGAAGAASPSGAGPGLHLLVRGRQAIALAPGVNVLGREATAAVRLVHPSVCRTHARITVDGDRAELEDVGGGTACRGEPVREPVLLFDGDELRVGEVALVYRLRPAASRGRG